MSNQHPDFFRHYASILIEDQSRSQRPMTPRAFEETLSSRCPYLSRAECAGILAVVKHDLAPEPVTA